jgi:hypothetical protein
MNGMVLNFLCSPKTLKFYLGPTFFRGRGANLGHNNPSTYPAYPFQ